MRIASQTIEAADAAINDCTDVVLQAEESMKARDAQLKNQEDLLKNQQEQITTQGEKIERLETRSTVHTFISIGVFILGLAIGIPISIP